MANNYIKQFLKTGDGTEGSLLIPSTIMNTIVEDVDKKLIPRSEAAMVLGPEAIPGSSVNINLEVLDSMDVRLTGEGSEYGLDNGEYTNINIVPKKYGTTIKITGEMIEDSQFPLLERSVRLAGKRFAENENSLVITDGLDNASNTVSGGAAVTIANITTAMQYLDDADFEPTTFTIGMEVLNDLRNIDTFVEADKFGNREMMEKGYVGTIFGMNCIKVSTNAGMTTTTAYVHDKMHGYIIAEKRRITMENYKLQSHDLEAVTLSQRIAVKTLRAQAISKITSS